MNKMSNFGCLSKDFFLKLDDQKEVDRLLATGFFVLIQEAKGDTSTIKNGVLELTIKANEFVAEPSAAIAEEIYDYIISIFNNDIILAKFIFFKNFNEEIYGHKLNYQKSIALNNFKKIYDSVCIDIITFFEETISENGIIHTKTTSKFKMLHGQQKARKRNLINRIGACNYLIGNLTVFGKDFLSENFEIIRNLIHFETQLKILVELNDRYHFEEDLFFTQVRFDKANFKNYKHIFKTLESYQFTNKKIKNFTKDAKSHIESLYEVLTSENLIYAHKENFMLFLKKEYDLTISKIISYTKNENYKHDKRVLLFYEELPFPAPKK